MPTRVTRRVTLDADALFDFDKATLRPAGRAALDEFVASVKTITPETITATGHADRFGSDAYNQRLSERRVQTVKAYLVGQNMDANRIRAVGKDRCSQRGKCLVCGFQSRFTLCLTCRLLASDGRETTRRTCIVDAGETVCCS